MSLNADKEVLPVIGSKEGLAHFAWCVIEYGDIALVPDPAYPVYGTSTILAGGKPHYMPLTAENHFLPDLDSIPADVLGKTETVMAAWS